MAPPPIKEAALALGLPVFQPASLRRPEVLADLAAAAPDLILVAAYGNYIPDEVCALAPRGSLNLHPSLLPRWRGASPVASAILAGDAETGATIHFVVAEMDAGDVLAQRQATIQPDDTTGVLTARLAELGADLFVETVGRWLAGEITPWRQEPSGVIWCDRLKKEQGRLDWTQPAEVLGRRVRAFQPWPGAFTTWCGQQLEISAAEPLPAWRGDATAGQVICAGGQILAATGVGALRLDVVQLAGKRALPAGQFAQGARGFCGSVLGV
jgi:methionyl-tRNA formyltransferase